MKPFHAVLISLEQKKVHLKSSYFTSATAAIAILRDAPLPQRTEDGHLK